MENTKITHIPFGNLVLKLTSDIISGEIIDTKVEVIGGVLCVVAGSEKDAFANELKQIVEKYRI